MADSGEVFDEFGGFPTTLEDKRIQTPSAGFNYVMGEDDEDGVSGIPHPEINPRIMMYWGPSGVGKSHIALETARAFCEEGLWVAYLDFEGGQDPELCVNIVGEDYCGSDFMLMRSEWMDGGRSLIDCDDLEDTIKGTDDYDGLIDIDGPGLVIIDSMEAVVPLEKDDSGGYKNVSEQGIGTKAANDALLLRQINGYCKGNNISVLMIEQQRTEFLGGGYQTRKTNSGGEAVTFYSDIKVRMKTKRRIKDDEGNHVASEIGLEAEKNKTGNLRNSVVQVRFGQGFDPVMSARMKIQDNIGKLDWIEKGGAGWYTITLDGEEEKVQGSNQLEDWVRERMDRVVPKLDGAGLIQ